MLNTIVSATALLLFVHGAAAAWPPLAEVDADRLGRLGLRVVESDHAQLVTDLPPSEAVDRLPDLIDQAVPQWGQRLAVDDKAAARWRMRLCLIREDEMFLLAGLMPEGGRRFPNGLALGYQTWVREQPTDYYRRHLVLHEATHSFMQTLLGGCGPGWHMEGVAELCGTHTLAGGDLRLAAFPASRDAAPMWGRVRLIRDAVAAGRGRSVGGVRSLTNDRPMDAEEYAWVWALAKLLDTHPRYGDRFRALAGQVRSPDFDERFDAAFEPARKRLEQEWRLFVGTIEYGHEIEREAIAFAEGRPLPTGPPHEIEVRVDRGWQSSGVRVEAGRQYELTASGRFTIAHEPDGAPWPCEPGGVTLDYHRGRPLGQLIAAIDAGPDAFLKTTSIGLGADFRPDRSGTLYLRANDRPNAISENRGSIAVTIARR